MSQMIPYHPAPGLGTGMFGGWHIVPTHPITTPGTPLVPSVQATAPNRVLRRPRLQELVAGGFTIPQNPLKMALSGGRMGVGDLMDGGFTIPQNPICTGGMSGLGCGCGCSGGQANYTLNGMGQLDTSSIGNFVSSIPSWLQEPSAFASIPNWLLYGGLAIGLDLYLSSRKRR